MVGFTASPSLADLTDIGHRAGVPVLDDLGSGALLDTRDFGLGHEPMVQESLQAGADLIAFSGDKLLGGPQAGILVGGKDWIARLRRHPLARALRIDKLTMAALHATLVHYALGEATTRIPVWRMMAAPERDLRERAEGWSSRLGAGQARPGRSTVGGGSLPEETLPTVVLALDSAHPNKTLAALRAATPPILARVDSDEVVLDPRTVLPEQDDALIAALRRTLAAG
jgi:L-seryl-tRNA(Ser) seleniumtransferase